MSVLRHWSEPLALHGWTQHSQASITRREASTHVFSFPPLAHVSMCCASASPPTTDIVQDAVRCRPVGKVGLTVAPRSLLMQSV
eukprot:6200170-Pleurochrysis_carterae.AAC.3